MKRQLCELITNFPTFTVLGLCLLAVLCLFSTLGTVCFLGLFCLLVRSVQKGREEGWIVEEETPPPRRPRRRVPPTDGRRAHSSRRAPVPSRR